MKKVEGKKTPERLSKYVTAALERDVDDVLPGAESPYQGRENTQ